MRIVTLNAGSSSVKASIAEADADRVAVSLRETVEGRGRGADALFAEALDRISKRDATIDAIGHRVVHGGNRFRGPAEIDAEVEAAIESLVPLAPLHNPVALAGIRAARARFPDRPMVAVFDTSFHAARSEASCRYALPEELAGSTEIRRYGFHGLAHESLIAAVAELEGRRLDTVTAVSLQLGRGCSVCAVLRGRSIETSMGFTPLEGLMMGTRSGDVDPGLILYLIRNGRSADEVEGVLERRSGLLGIGGSADVRELFERQARGDERAALALEMFVRRIVMTAGSYLTLLGGEGAIVFGGGIGENSVVIRERIAQGLEVWNVRLDPSRNAERPPVKISADGTRDVFVVPTDEETIIARAVAATVRLG
jgi:acetate kinase